VSRRVTAIPSTATALHPVDRRRFPTDLTPYVNPTHDGSGSHVCILDPATPGEVRAALDRGERFSALDAMVGAVLYGGGDWKELQELYLGYSITRIAR
jgi:hypothetical protein